MHSHSGHCHEHGHHHGHTHFDPSAGRNALAWTLALALVYLVAEIVGGYVTHSLALFADAGHMFSDVAGLGLSWFALWLAQQPTTPQQTYGYHRAEIFAALINGGALIGIAVMILIEAIKRFLEPAEVLGKGMLVVAVGGLVVNLIGLVLLSRQRHSNLNLRGAWLHVLTDALGSVGAIAAALLIWLFQWNWADPLISIVISLLVVFSAWRLFVESVGVLLEHAPSRIDMRALTQAIQSVEDVVSVHDLHVWTITSGFEALSAHVVTRRPEASMSLLTRLRSMLSHDFGLEHVTIQIESEAIQKVYLPKLN